MQPLISQNQPKTWSWQPEQIAAYVLKGQALLRSADATLVLPLTQPSEVLSEMVTPILSICFFTAMAMLIHELGHLVAARRCNVPASELALGFGPRLLGFSLMECASTCEQFRLVHLFVWMEPH